MRTVTAFIAIFWSILAVTTTADATSDISARPLSAAKELTFSSSHLKNAQIVHVYLPEGYDMAASHVRFPVIYTLDGWTLSQSVSGVVEHLGKTASMPKAIVVAITSDDDYAYGPAIYTSKSGWQDDPAVRLEGFSGGNADAYLSFVEKELIPYIDDNYQTNDFRALIGMSPSATFALHTFWKAPELFDAHFVFAATDVIGMGYTPDTTFIDKLAESLAKNPDRKGYLYVASAQREADANPARNKNIAALKEALAPYTDRNFKLRAEHIDNFGHYPMAIPGLLRALDLVFPRADWDIGKRFNQIIRQEGNALKNLLSYHEMLSQQVGFEVRPNTDLRRNANCLRVAGYRLRAQERFEESEQIYQYWIKDNPNSAKAYAGLAATMEAAGRLELAIHHGEKATSLAKRHMPELVDFYKDWVAEVRTKLAARQAEK